ncbi:MAG: PLP-dependent aminotransferase family protein [Paracoccaceae bacterium]
MTDTIWLPDLTQYPGPKYLGLARALREAIRGGQLPPGSQLPTVRDLAWKLQVTPGTVSRAYQLATQEGLLGATVGRGTFVQAAAPRLGPTQSLFIERPEVQSNLVDLRSPILPEVGQAEVFAQALRAMADQTDKGWIDYTSQSAETGLRAAVVDWLDDRELGPVAANDLALTHGGQSAVGLVLNCCLRGERPVVLLEELAYPGFRYAARLSRAEAVAVEIDAEGMRPDALEAACRRHGPQVLCLTPEAQNPTAGRMSLKRRQEIVSIARSHDLQIVEDDCYSAAEHALPTLRALAPERVWHVGSLSKTLSAALRFGWVVCPEGMGEAGRLTAQHEFFALSRPVSDLCLHLFQSGAAVEIRSRILTETNDRLALLVDRLEGFDLTWQSGLAFCWLGLPQGWRASAFARAAEDAGVLVRTADQYSLTHGRAPHAVRLAMAGNVPQDRIAAAAEALALLLPRPPTDMAV